MKTHSMTIRLATMIALSLPTAALRAGSPESSAVGWWRFEGNSSGQNGKDLTAVPTNAPKLEPAATLGYEPVSGLTAGNAGSQAVKFDGASVLKSSDRAFRIGEAQTLWLRVKFSAIPGQQTALIARSRPRKSLYGISLELKDGAPAGFVSSDGQAIDAGVTGQVSLEGGEWYDIALRFDPQTSLRLDLHSPATGKKLGSWQSQENIPASIPADNVAGSGYLQIGAINNGSAGSMWAVPDGTLIEAAGIWDRSLSDEELGELSRPAK
jgi:hypothetical protein